jgi:hypothetical protein
MATVAVLSTFAFLCNKHYAAKKVGLYRVILLEMEAREQFDDVKSDTVDERVGASGKFPSITKVFATSNPCWTSLGRFSFRLRFEPLTHSDKCCLRTS